VTVTAHRVRVRRESLPQLWNRNAYVLYSSSSAMLFFARASCLQLPPGTVFHPVDA
jgi:hypothetical protein